jgi:Ca-activated chloride channel family protein
VRLDAAKVTQIRPKPDEFPINDARVHTGEERMPKYWIKGALAAVCGATLLGLVACATQTAEPKKTEQGQTGAGALKDVTLTEQKGREGRTRDGSMLPPPPAPPPPPPLAMPPPPAAMVRAAPRIGMAAPPVLPPQRPAGDIDTERYMDVAPNPVKSVAQEPVSTFSIDVDTASYANVRRFLNDGRLPPRDAVRVEEMINYFDYDYPLPATRERPFETTVSVVPSPWGRGKQLVHIGLQGYNITPRERPPLNLSLLLDVSGSMNAPEKLPLVVKSMKMLVDQLTARDRVSITVYAGAAGAVLEPTLGNEKGKIIAALDSLSAGGSTAGGQGLALAYRLAERNFDRGAVNRVIIATDGDFNVGVTDDQRLEDFVARKRSTGIYLSVLGFGGGNYNDQLMQTLAQKGNGTAAYIDTLNEARKVFHDQMQSALLPIADDVKIQVEFNPARVAEYRLIGYETRMLNREDFNNDRVDAGEIGAGASVTAIYEITPPGGPMLNDPSRYAPAAPPSAGRASEIAYLRIRYKPPGLPDSILIERPIGPRDVRTDLVSAPESTRFATAVAGFGQLLRGDPFLDRGFGYEQVLNLAQGARGRDEFGWRAEFTQLVRAASTASADPEQSNPIGRPEPQPRPMPMPPPPRR